MQSTSSASLSSPLSNWFYPIPVNLLHSFYCHPSRLNSRKSTINLCSLSLHTTRHCSTLQRYQNLTNKSHSSHPFQDSSLFHQFHSPFSSSNITNQDPEPQDEEQEESQHQSTNPRERDWEVLFSNMWWVDLKAALGQRINVEGVVSSVYVFVKDRHLVLPHVTVPDISYIDWGELKKRGFKGVVFDKDNTITAPYSLTLWPPLSSSIERCKAVFGHDIAVFSNSVGLSEYDHDGSKARALEGAIGIKVIRHRVKKPAGTAEEVEKHFGCASSHLIMVGDRSFTDIVYGNRNGFLTILTEPLSLVEEPFIVKQVRKLEVCLVNLWFRRGLKPTSHNLLPDAMQYVKDPPPL